VTNNFFPQLIDCEITPRRPRTQAVRLALAPILLFVSFLLLVVRCRRFFPP